MGSGDFYVFGMIFAFAGIVFAKELAKMISLKSPDQKPGIRRFLRREPVPRRPKPLTADFMRRQKLL
jgi:hypothetical protein